MTEIEPTPEPTVEPISDELIATLIRISRPARDQWVNLTHRTLLSIEARLRSDAAEIASLRVDLAALQAERAWKPIETAPHGVNVLLYCPDRGITNPARVELGPATSGTSNAVSSSMSSHAWATRWQPLPSLPTEETKTNQEPDPDRLREDRDEMRRLAKEDPHVG